MKIQYPGVADSVESDLRNLQLLVKLTNILPPGLYIDEIIKVRAFRPRDHDLSYLVQACLLYSSLMTPPNETPPQNLNPKGYGSRTSGILNCDTCR